MIAKISGVLLYKSIEYIIIDVNGIGYRVFVPYSTYYNLPDKNLRLSLDIYTHVKNDGISLYGFFTSREKNLFESLISISKIGPKLAINILSGSSVEELNRAILRNDIAKISSIPGIGRKTAERIALELKYKISHDFVKKDDIKEDKDFDQKLSDCISALVNLGYNKKIASGAVERIRQNLQEDTTFEEILKSSLKALAR